MEWSWYSVFSGHLEFISMWAFRLTGELTVWLCSVICCCCCCCCCVCCWFLCVCVSTFSKISETTPLTHYVATVQGSQGSDSGPMVIRFMIVIVNPDDVMHLFVCRFLIEFSHWNFWSCLLERRDDQKFQCLNNSDLFKCFWGWI